MRLKGISDKGLERVARSVRAKTDEIGDYFVEVVEERRGQEVDAGGYIQPTYNCYAGIGYELDEAGEKTGRIIAWAGNNAMGSEDVVQSLDLDDYLEGWDREWTESFRSEGIM